MKFNEEQSNSIEEVYALARKYVEIASQLNNMVRSIVDERVLEYKPQQRDIFITSQCYWTKDVIRVSYEDLLNMNRTNKVIDDVINAFMSKKEP